MPITPGLRFLLKKLPPLVGLVAAVYLLGLPLWACFVSAVISPPLALIVYASWYDLKVRWDADAAGARTIPRAKGKRLGNLDIMDRVLKMWLNGYPGMSGILCLLNSA